MERTHRRPGCRIRPIPETRSRPRQRLRGSDCRLRGRFTHSITATPSCYLKGMKHVQMEPVWGGSVDTAAELRAVCAMGLASTRWPDKLRELVHLLVDREWQARAGAARALGAIGSEPALLLLRLKALSGDPEPEVLADCFTGLLVAEDAERCRFVASFARLKRPRSARSRSAEFRREPPRGCRRMADGALRARSRCRDSAVHSPVARHFEDGNRDRVSARADSRWQRNVLRR